MARAPEIFNAQADRYDAVRRRLIPPFDAFYGTAVAALGLTGRPIRRVLDLGAGTGLLSVRVREAYPDAHITALDAAAAMLDQARQRLGDERTDFVHSDLAGPLPEGPWDAVTSALAIHHLDDAAQRDLFARVRATVPDGGVFVNAEQVVGPAPRFTGAYERWHEQQARAAGVTDQEWADTEARMRYDRCATVEEHLAWLGEAGFAAADCLFKHYRFAVIVAVA